MKAIFYWKNTKRRKNSYIFLSTIILIFLFTGISLSLAMIHANQIASLENVIIMKRELIRLLKKAKIPKIKV